MQRTALDIIRYITTEIEHKHLPREVMIRDVQMMGFKIRSLIGDISVIDGMSSQFIEALWKIGKVDEIINEEIEDISEEEQDTLLAYFSDLENHMREEIKGSLNFKKPAARNDILKLEIFKEFDFAEPVN